MFDLMVSYANSVNLFITNLCNSACPYCCVRDWITHDSEKAQYMSFRDLGRVIEVLKRSGIDSVRLLGGEPMLHPEIGRFVEKLLAEGIDNVAILTNGLGETDLYCQIMKMGDVKWCFNVNDPRTYAPEDWKRLNTNLGLLSWKGERDAPLGHAAYEERGLFRLQLAIVFYEKNQDYGYIVELAKKLGCGIIAFDISHPSAGKSNVHLRLEDLAGLKPALLGFFDACLRERIKPNLGCVLPPCIFSPREMAFISLFVAGVNFECAPTVDVMPDLTVHYCSSMRDALPSYDLKELQGERNFHHLYNRLISDSEEAKRCLPCYCEGCHRFEHKICQGYCLRLKTDSVKSLAKEGSVSKVLGRYLRKS